MARAPNAPRNDEALLLRSAEDERAGNKKNASASAERDYYQAPRREGVCARNRRHPTPRQRETPQGSIQERAAGSGARAVRVWRRRGRAAGFVVQSTVHDPRSHHGAVRRLISENTRSLTQGYSSGASLLARAVRSCFPCSFLRVK